MASVLVLQALEMEWAVIVSSRWSRDRLRSWAATSPVFDALDQILTEIRSGDRVVSRELSWGLLDRVADDDLARRAVL